MATKNTERPVAESGFRPNLRTIPNPNGGGDVAEYITPERSGLESGFYVTDRGLPWHVTLARRLDTPELMTGSDRKLTVGEALVLGGLDWEVGTASVFVTIDKKKIPVAGRKVTYRKDTGAILSVNTVSDAYKVVQNRDAFTFADTILDVGGAHCETAGSLFGGRHVFLSMELPDEIAVVGDPSDYRLFLLISNGHDGMHSLRLDVTIERVVCRNTLKIAKGRAISSWAIRHTSGIDGRVQEAKNALGIVHRYAEEFSGAASALVATSLVDRQVDDILARLFPLTETQQERVDKDADKILVMPQGIVREIYQTSPTVDPVRGTAYGILSAVTEYVDHFKTYRGEGAEDSRAEHLMFDDGDVKQRAWDLLTTVKK
jgi:phage/plasmid-like protein (TIGR03299 family)